MNYMRLISESLRKRTMAKIILITELSDEGAIRAQRGFNSKRSAHHSAVRLAGRSPASLNGKARAKREQKGLSLSLNHAKRESPPFDLGAQITIIKSTKLKSLILNRLRKLPQVSKGGLPNTLRISKKAHILLVIYVLTDTLFIINKLQR